MFSKGFTGYLVALTLGLLVSTGARGAPPLHQWSAAYGGSAQDEVTDCVVDAEGNYIVTGRFGYQIQLTVVWGSQGEDDFFVAKVDPSGAHVWGRVFGGLGRDVSAAVAVDDDGGIYVTGSFEGVVDFGGGQLASAGRNDIFLLKLDTDGDHVWSRSFGDADEDFSTDIAVDDPNGYLYLTGGFARDLDFGAGPMTSHGELDLFLAKIKTNGNPVWSHSFGANDRDRSTAVALDASGNVVITGECDGPIDLGGGPVTAFGRSDAYMAVYDPDGVHMWSQTLGGSDFDYAFDILVDGNDDIVLTGCFNGTADFGGGPVVSAGGEDIFLAKYKSNGAHTWSSAYGGAEDDRGLAMAVNGVDEIFLTGSFRDKIDFGGGNLVTDGREDVFLAKFKGGGTYLWSQRFGDTRGDQGSALAVDAGSNVCMGGYFQSWTDFGGGLLHGDHYGLDAFVACYRTDGVHLWSHAHGSMGYDVAVEMETDAAGNLIVAGLTHGTVDFGGGPLVGNGLGDIFVAKFDPSGSHIWSLSAGSPGPDELTDMVMDADGNIYICGTFQASVDFGGGLLTSAGDDDVFLVKYDPSGNHLWSKSFGDFGEEYHPDVAVDAAGNVVLSGGFWGIVDFGGGPLVCAGNIDVFIAEFDPSGGHIWSHRYGEWNVEYGYCVTIDEAGDIVLCGHFADTIDFGGGILTAPDQTAKFLVKFDSEGSHVWSRLVDADVAFFHAIISGPMDSFTITGTFYDTIDLGGGPLVSAGNQDILIARYDTDGNHTWSERYGNTGVDSGSRVARTPSGGFLVTGFFEESVDFGGGPLAAAGGFEVFLAEFTVNDRHLWSVSYGSPDREAGSAVATDPWGDMFIAGTFTDDISLGGPTLSSSRSMDFYVAKLGQVTGVEDDFIPSSLVLGPAHPNPFTGETVMKLDISQVSRASLIIYSASGRLLRTLVDGELGIGRHSLTWDGLDESGRRVPAGIYFARLKAADRRSAVKIVRIE